MLLNVYNPKHKEKAQEMKFEFALVPKGTRELKLPTELAFEYTVSPNLIANTNAIGQPLIQSISTCGHHLDPR